MAGGSPAARPISRRAIAKRVRRVDQQQDVEALVAEVLGDAGGGVRGAQAHQRRLVGGGDDDDDPVARGLAEVVLEELAHLAAALADQADDDDVGRRVPRAIMPSSVDLPTPEPAKMPTRWPRPQGVMVSRARTPSGSGSAMRWRRSGCGAAASSGRARRLQRGAVVDRAAEGVEHAAGEVRADAHPQAACRSARRARRGRRRRARRTARAAGRPRGRRRPARARGGRRRGCATTSPSAPRSPRASASRPTTRLMPAGGAHGAAAAAGRRRSAAVMRSSRRGRRRGPRRRCAGRRRR